MEEKPIDKNSLMRPDLLYATYTHSIVTFGEKREKNKTTINTAGEIDVCT